MSLFSLKKLAVSCIAALPILAGCSVAVDTEVSTEGKFTGTYTMTVSADSMAGMMGGMGSAPGMSGGGMEGESGGSAGSEGMTLPKGTETSWTEGNVSGKDEVTKDGTIKSTVTFNNATSEEINAAMQKHNSDSSSGTETMTTDNEFPLVAEVSGDQMTVKFASSEDTVESGLDELSPPGEEMPGATPDPAASEFEAGMEEMMLAMLEGMTFDMTVVMPGVINDVDGILAEEANQNSGVQLAYDQSTMHMKASMGDLYNIAQKYAEQTPDPTMEPNLLSVTSPTTGGVGRTDVTLPEPGTVTTPGEATPQPYSTENPTSGETPAGAVTTENSSSKTPLLIGAGVLVLIAGGILGYFVASNKKNDAGADNTDDIGNTPEV